MQYGSSSRPKSPDFTLPDNGLKQRKLSESLGKKLVLAFFPGEFASVCTKEMCNFGVYGAIKRVEGTGRQNQSQ